MKQTQKMISAAIVFIFLISCSCNRQELGTNAFFISLEGNDNWSGRLATPNKNKTDGPFATFQRAKSAVRSLKKSDSLTAPVHVYVRGGDYEFHTLLQLNEKDSGTPVSPVKWQAYPNEKVTLRGSKIITGFKAISDSSILKRFTPQARDYVLMADLKAQGIHDYGRLKAKGFGRKPIQPLTMELFFNQQPMVLARYPNDGWLTIKNVPQDGDKPEHAGSAGNLFNGIPAGRHYGRFEYNGNRPSRWHDFDDIWMHGFWTWDWADTYNNVAEIDTINNLIYPAKPYCNYGYRQGQRYYFLNILEELDAPKEYYIDRDNGLLYFWPPFSVNEGKAEVSMLTDPFFRLDNCRHVEISGFIFQACRGKACVVTGGERNLIAGSVFRNIGNEAVVFEQGYQNGIKSCNLYNLAGTAIKLHGGDRPSLKPGNLYAINNHIHHYDRVFYTYQAAIDIDGVENHAAHNLIHDAPHMAILFRGNEHLLEYNEVHTIAEKTGDVGAFYIGRDWSCRGNEIRYNYFHHMHGPGLHGVNAVYLDDFASGTLVFGNLFYKVDRGAFIGGGRDNIIKNNIFVDCFPSIHVDARGLGWADKYFTGEVTTLYDRMSAMNYDQPPYSERYPELLTLYEDEPAVAKDNVITQNISYQGRWMDIYDGLDFNDLHVKDNLIAASEPSQWSPFDDHVTEKKNWIYLTFENDNLSDELNNTQNLVIDHDPGFKHAESKNWNLEKNSPAFGLGFQPIPIGKIGLKNDIYRKTLQNLK